MQMRHIQPAVLLLCCLTAAGARADEFSDRCAALPQQANITITFKDREVLSDNSRTIQELNRIAGKPPGDYHNVYGLTRAVPDLRMRAAPRSITTNDGRICAVPDIALELGFSEFIVYLAKELTDPCQQDIVRQHEQEHVNTWKSHLRASSQLLVTVLRRNLGDARTYASTADATEGIGAWARELVAPWPKRVLDSVIEAQNAIDTPVSYGIVTSRLRTCGQAVRGGSR